MISLPSFLSSLGENYIVSIIILKFAAWLPSTAISIHTRFKIVQCPLKVKKKKKKKKPPNNPSTCSFSEISNFSGETVRASGIKTRNRALRDHLLMSPLLK